MHEELSPAPRTAIPNEDWEQTPFRVKQWVESREERIQELEQQLAAQTQLLGELQAQIQLLQEQQKRTSSNSSKPPSSDPPSAPKRRQKKSSGKKRGGQEGHVGHSRRLYAIEQCESVVDHYLEQCRCCGGQLHGADANPYRHQVVEIPPIAPIVVEHRLHQRTCEQCGTASRAQLPEGVCQTGYGPRVVAITALLSGLYRHSQRMVQSAMQDLFGVWMCLGTVNRLRQEASTAVAYSVAETQEYVQQQPVVGADETSFAQRNADKGNPDERSAWLWVAVTPLVTYFQVLLSRSQEAAQTLLGKTFGGILISDRHSSYNWIELAQRQVCPAHLKRDFIKISERPGVCEQIGEALLKQQEKLFELWHRVRDGTLSRAEFITAASQLRAAIKALLEEGASYEIGSKEKTPLAHTVRTCRNLLQVEPAMWLFVTTVGVEPTNNASERALRPAVLWRRTSFGSQSVAGSTFVARMLTVVTTVRSQGRNVLEYLTHAIGAARSGQPAPSLLPPTTPVSDHILPAA